MAVVSPLVDQRLPSPAGSTQASLALVVPCVPGWERRTGPRHSPCYTYVCATNWVDRKGRVEEVVKSERKVGGWDREMGWRRFVV